MGKQVNMLIDEEHYEVLVREVGKRMAATGKYMSIGALAAELIKPSIAKLNGQAPSKDDKQDTNPDDKQENSKLASAFDKIDF